jgi:hypothetical protein
MLLTLDTNIAGKKVVDTFWFVGGTLDRLNEIQYFDGHYSECVPAFNFYRTIIQLLNMKLFDISFTDSSLAVDIIKLIVSDINRTSGVLKMRTNIIDIMLNKIKSGIKY